MLWNVARGGSGGGGSGDMKREGEIKVENDNNRSVRNKSGRRIHPCGRRSGSRTWGRLRGNGGGIQ